MGKKFFDYDDADYGIAISNNMAVDSVGNLMMRVSDNRAMDMETGDIHFTSNWSSEDEDD